MIKAAVKHIYFMKPIGMIGPIKIGCSGFVGERLVQLSTWSPIPLEVIHSEPGEHTLERKIHRAFADIHSHHEWFHPGPRLLRAIEQLKGGVPLADAIDLNDDRGSIYKHGKGSKACAPIMEGYRSYSCRIRHAEDKAGRTRGGRWYVPVDVELIMNRWLGNNGYGKPKTPKRPTDAEFARMEAVLTAPTDHLIPYEVRFPKPKTVGAAA